MVQTAYATVDLVAEGHNHEAPQAPVLDDAGWRGERRAAVTVDRARGCLLGLAIGDALGAPVEGLSRAALLRRHGEVRDYLGASGPGRCHLPGLYTDDTQQALVLADVLAEARGFDGNLARRKYLELAQPAPGLPRGALRSTAGNFRAAIELMARDGSGSATGVPSAGNGAAMRIAPIGIWYATDAEGLRRAAIEASLQTHADPRGVSAAVAVACLVGRLAASSVSGPAEALAALADAIACILQAEEDLAGEPDPGAGNPTPPRTSAVLRLLEPLWEAEPWEVLRTIVIGANRQQPAQPVSGPGDPFAPASVPTAIYLALHAPSFEEAVLEAVNLGGDADTVGAMTGALAGARWGAEAIPARWLDGLANREGILARADALVGGGKGAGSWESLATAERRLSLVQLRTREGW